MLPAGWIAEPMTEKDSCDRLFATSGGDVAGFRFDESVAAVFSDMIERSVPGYETVIGMTGVLASRFAENGSRLYDLGCSLGAGALSMARAVAKRECRIVAVDNSPAMIRRLAGRLEDAPPPTPVETVLGDVCEVDIREASVVAVNYTLQFVPLERRAALVARIRRGMRPGGVLILSEKVCFEDEAMDALFIDLYHEFKRRRGYSDLEISRKRAALENVLVPESLDAHRRRLREAGFGRIEAWFQCFNFASLVAFP